MQTTERGDEIRASLMWLNIEFTFMMFKEATWQGGFDKLVEHYAKMKSAMAVRHLIDHYYGRALYNCTMNELYAALARKPVWEVNTFDAMQASINEQRDHCDVFTMHLHSSRHNGHKPTLVLTFSVNQPPKEYYTEDPHYESVNAYCIEFHFCEVEDKMQMYVVFTVRNRAKPILNDYGSMIDTEDNRRQAYVTLRFTINREAQMCFRIPEKPGQYVYSELIPAS
jgi:hypothetical protein